MKHAQLWKRILNEGFVGDYIYEWDSNERISKAVITSPIVVDTRPPESLRVATWDDIRGIAFPFESFWLEGSCHVVPNPTEFAAGARWGALIETEKEDFTTKATCSLFVCSAESRPRLIGAFVFNCSATGAPIGRPEAHVNDDVRMAQERNGINVGNVIMGFGYLIADTLLLLGCKNVSLEPRDNDPKQVRRAVKRHGGTPDSYRYHVLVVRPPGAKSDAPAQEIGIMPRHVCRGHFAEYGPEFGKGLLFGKYSGRFYVPPHMKGNKKNGTVGKDYAIR